MDYRKGDAGGIRPARSRRNHDACRIPGSDVFDGCGVVSNDPDRTADLFKILHQIIGKRIIIVDHHDHGVSPELNQVHQLQRFFNGFGLVHGFNAFAFGVRIRHDAGAGPNREPAVFDAGGSNGNGQIHVSAEGNIPDGASVRSAGLLFEFGNDLHGPDLGSAAECSGRKRGPEQIPGIQSGLQIAGDVGDQVHDMGIAFNHHQIRHLNRPGFRNPSQVVAAQIHQHEVLRPLFFISQKLIGQSPVFLLGFSSGPGSGNGSKGGDAVFKAHHGFRRRSDQRLMIHAEKKQIR